MASEFLRTASESQSESLSVNQLLIKEGKRSPDSVASDWIQER